MKLKFLTPGPKDERASAQLGPIYKVGFYIMMFGILFDVCTRYNYMAQMTVDGTKVVTSPIELAVLFVACLVVCIMMTVRGVYSDDMRYLNARSYAQTGQVVPSVAIGAMIAVAATGGRLCSEVAINGWASVTWAGDIAMLIVMMVMFIPLCLAVSFLSWRSYRKKEDKLAAQEENEE